MQTLRSAVSDIINDLRAYNLDDKFSFRFLSNKLMGKIDIFVKQDSDLRTLFSINEIWKPIPCIELEDAPNEVCSEFYDGDYILKRSKRKIPRVYTGRSGNFIKILNVTGSNEYKQIKSFEYKDIKNREYKNKKTKYFWIENDYLYIPDVEIEEVKGIGMFKYSVEVDHFNKSCDECYKPLDSDILVPDYIVDLAKTATLTELAQINKRTVVDESPDLNSNKKTNP